MTSTARPLARPTHGALAERAWAGFDPSSATLTVVPLRDPAVEEIGYHPRSEYVELFWLPVIGPSATLLLRRLADGMDAGGGRFEVAPAELAASLGLGSGSGAGLARAVGRCVRFGLARPAGGAALAVRRLVAPLPRRQLMRLPLSLQARHRAWEAGRQGTPPADAWRRRARLLALDLAQLGEERQAIERHLARWGIHPALAADATRWALRRPGKPED